MFLFIYAHELQMETAYYCCKLSSSNKKGRISNGSEIQRYGLQKIIHCSLNITKGLKKRFGEPGLIYEAVVLLYMLQYLQWNNQ